MVQAKIKKNVQEKYLVFLPLIAIIMLVFFESAIANQSGFSDYANLTVWSGGTPNSQNKTLSNDLFGSQKTIQHWNFYFYANYTNSSFYQINSSNGNGLCIIRFNETGNYNSYGSMSYNISLSLWEFNRSFNYKGNLSYNLVCNSSFGNVSLIDIFHVINSDPRKMEDPSSFNASEDTLTYYEFNRNVTDDDLNDLPLIYTLENITSDNHNGTNTSLYPWIFINSSGAIFSNATHNNHNGTYNLGMKASDSGESGIPSPITKTAIITIYAVNDAPVFNNLANRSFNMSSPANPLKSEYVLNVSDEENDVPFTLNISFLNCTAAQWSTRYNSTSSNSTNCQLFNSSQYSFNTTSGFLNISFYPGRDDVGNYTINFTVRDLDNMLSPYNASTSRVVIFNVLTRNTEPSFTYVCNNESNATENSYFSCFVNATDIDENVFLKYFANYSWVTFNDTNSDYSNGTVTGLANLTANFTSFAIINFTPGDAQVGNWSIKVTILDNGSYGDVAKSSFGYFNLSIANVPDLPLIQSISNITVYKNYSQTIYINSSDDDLLIPDKSIYNEVLTFQSNLSWVSVSSCSAAECGTGGTNRTTIKVLISPPIDADENYTVKINVTDMTNYTNYTILTMRVLYNNPPNWFNVSNNITKNENEIIYVNLSQYVSHNDSDQGMIFSYTNNTLFPDFTLNRTSGIISFNTDDIDIGQHILNITVSDTVAQDSFIFNFTIYNVDDGPSFVGFVAGGNITINSLVMNTTDWENVTFYLYVKDDDFVIPVAQKSFYNESLNISNYLGTYGVPFSMFNFGFKSFLSSNVSIYQANFIPNSSDIGFYQVLVNISDNSSGKTSVFFNLTINDVAHSPYVIVSNQTYSIFENLSLDINGNDYDEGNETVPGANLTYNISSLTSGGNFIRINQTTGVVMNLSGSTNFSLRNVPGSWLFNVSVADSTKRNGSALFSLNVYDYPKILLPTQNTYFNLAENVSANLSFSANHTVQDDLNYSLFINGELRKSLLGAGNGSIFLFEFTPSFDDETTCSENSTFILNVSNPKFSNFSMFISKLTVNHSNSPLEFVNNIGGANQTIIQESPITRDLSEYFSDSDAFPSCNRQKIGFYYILNSNNGSTINVTIVNWTSSTPIIVFSSSDEAYANCTIIGQEYDQNDNTTILRNVSSNIFFLHILKSATTVPLPSTGGGGGGGGGGSGEGSGEKPKPEPEIVLLKLVLPDPVSVDKKDKIVLPISLVNDGNRDLNGISLSSTFAKNGTLVENVTSYFNVSEIPFLGAGESENLTLTIETSTQEEGLYEITVNASVLDPVYTDWGKIYLQVKAARKIDEKIVFVEELLVGNPECAEIQELVNEAKKDFDNNNIAEAERKIDEAISACKRAIMQKPNPRESNLFQEYFFGALGIAAVAFFAIAIAYYFFKRRALRRLIAVEPYMFKKV